MYTSNMELQLIHFITERLFTFVTFLERSENIQM